MLRLCYFESGLVAMKRTHNDPLSEGYAANGLEYDINPSILLNLYPTHETQRLRAKEGSTGFVTLPGVLVVSWS